METITLRRTAQRDLRFKGELVAEVATSPDTAAAFPSGDRGRWSEIEVYRTESGTYVVSQMDGSQWQGEPGAIYRVLVFESLEELADWVANSSPLTIAARDSLLRQLNLPPEEL